MALIKHGRLIVDDWLTIADDAMLPPAGPVIVSLSRWKADREALLARNTGRGVLLAGGDAAEELAGDLSRIDLIAVAFGKFTDGRGYSTARLLRERYRYAGELRAVGNVLRDQLGFMARCGFDAVELDSADAGRDWREAVGEISGQYQPPPATPADTLVDGARRP
jgi:uncharacterized protein (DUF934 family)